MKKLIPKYAILPLILMITVNVFTYSVTPLWTNRMKHYSLTLTLDSLFPFIPLFVIPYVFAYVQWVIGYVLIARTDFEYCYKFLYGEIIAKMFTCMSFLLLPTTMTRAVINNTDIFSNLVSCIYSIDKPINLFPSIHCLESWICFRSSFNRQYFKPEYTSIMGIMTLLVFLSTVFIKQHVVMDMIGAVLMAETGLLVMKMVLKPSWQKSHLI